MFGSKRGLSSVFFLVALLAFGPGEGYGDLPPAAGFVSRPLSHDDGLRFFVDTASFRGPDGATLQEFYLLMSAKQLRFVEEDDDFVSQVRIAVEITDLAGKRVADDTHTRGLSVESLSLLRAAGGPVRDRVGFALDPGRYRFSYTVEDVHADVRGDVAATIEVESYEDTLTMSEPIFSSQIEATEEGRFSRHGWSVVPEASRVYAVGSAVYFYHEIYNLSPPGERGAFDVKYELTDTAGVSVSRSVDHRYKKGGGSAVLVDSISTKGLDEGPYYLQVQALDWDTKQLTVRRSPFVVKGIGGESLLSAEEAARLRHYRDIRWVAFEKDYRTYEQLPDQVARDTYLRTFWAKIDPSPGTPINERLMTHLRRSAYADEHFSDLRGSYGSRTDKGRVYIRYGTPTDRAVSSNDEGGKPFEIWHYETTGNYDFIFRDRRGLGVYELVHSTRPGEIYNPNWELDF